jgi:glucose-6-phosphate 1-dehydrogenase
LVLVRGYREENGVRSDSMTETFVAARVLIDNWRWAGVPFYLRTGKRLPRNLTEIAIQFRRAPHLVFRGQHLGANNLILNLQPDEGISICFHVKIPGQEMRLKDVAMNFSYRSEGGGQHSAYSTLLNDCMRGDATLFRSAATASKAAWRIVDPILETWRTHPAPAAGYPAGAGTARGRCC